MNATTALVTLACASLIAGSICFLGSSSWVFLGQSWGELLLILGLILGLAGIVKSFLGEK